MATVLEKSASQKLTRTRRFEHDEDEAADTTIVVSEIFAFAYEDEEPRMEALRRHDVRRKIARRRRGDVIHGRRYGSFLHNRPRAKWNTRSESGRRGQSGQHGVD